MNIYNSRKDYSFTVSFTIDFLLTISFLLQRNLDQFTFLSLLQNIQKSTSKRAEEFSK